MTKWILKGLRTGVVSTRYPRRAEGAPGATPGRPEGAPSGPEAGALAACCPTGALVASDGEVGVSLRRCVHCFRCVREAPAPIRWSNDYEWATEAPGRGARPLPRRFAHSLHVLVVDAGDCGACLREVTLLNSPYYNMHRLGFFVTPTPRRADVLLVVGPVTDPMRTPLQKAYEAMPEPKVVVAAGACALTGSVFGPSFACGDGVASVIPVDVEVPGHPPPPLAILHGLLVAAGRRPPAVGRR